MTAEQDLVTKLVARLNADRKRLLKYDHYHEGLQPLKYMAPALEAELGDRIAQLVINWPRMIASAYDDRQDVVGFRWTDSQNKRWDDELWDVFLGNDGLVRSQQMIFESGIMGRSYAILGSGDSPSDMPVFTEESPLQVIVMRDPRTRKIVAAVKTWKEEDDTDRAVWANLYLPDVTITFRNVGRGWTQKAIDRHNLGEVLVFEFLNGGRILRPGGISVFHDGIGPADACNKMATDMMVGGEFHMMPRRWALGFNKQDFKDAQGNDVDAFSVLAGRIWTSSKGPKEAEFGQFTPTDMANFHNTIKLLVQIIGQLAFLPDDYTSFTTENPPSADSVKAKESRFIKRIERKNQRDGAVFGHLMAAAVRLMGHDDPKLMRLKTLWRNPATPTLAQVADATVKLATGDTPIIPKRFAREQLDYSPEDIERMEKMDAEELAANPLNALADQLRQPAPTGNAAA